MNERSYPRRRPGGLSAAAMICFLALLLLPALAILRLAQTFDWRFVLGYALLISAVTCLLYKHDKQQAQSGGWRTPEATLHFVELLGGWPAAFLAQRALRHKTSKAGYQSMFWLIIAVHQFAAFDFTKDWRYSSKALLLLEQANRLAHGLPV